jgi:hypothetical protein
VFAGDPGLRTCGAPFKKGWVTCAAASQNRKSRTRDAREREVAFPFASMNHPPCGLPTAARETRLADICGPRRRLFPEAETRTWKLGRNCLEDGPFLSPPGASVTPRANFGWRPCRFASPALTGCRET